MKLKLAQIRTDGGTQPRAELRDEVIADYAELMESGVNFPPVIVFFDGTNYWLADGFHRLMAARRAAPDTPLQATVHPGTLQDAQWFSYSVNKTHGLRRTNEDKERALRAALAHDKAASLSNVRIAEHCGVGETSVRNYREQMNLTSQIAKSNDECAAENEDAPAPRLRKGRDGRTINTSRIGGSRRAATPTISPRANLPTRGHSDPCPMIPLQFSPNNPATAAAVLMRLFPRTFIESLIQLLSQHLAQGENV